MIGPLAGVKRNTLALIDQGLVSGTNFVSALMLARFAALSEYGAYVLAFAVLTFVQAVQGGLMIGPLLVFGASRRGHEFNAYVKAMARLLIFLVAAVTLLLGIVAFISYQFHRGMTGTTGALVCLAASIPFILIWEFLRRIMYCAGYGGRAVVMDMALMAIQIGTLSTLLMLDLGRGGHHWLSAGNAVLAIGLACFVASLPAVWWLRDAWRARAMAFRAALAECWSYGRWGGASTLLALGYAQGNYLILGAMLGAEAVAQFDGPRLIVAPLILAITAWSNVVVPAGARTFASEGMGEAIRLIIRAATPLAVLLLACLAVVLIFPDEMVGIVLGPRFQGAQTTLILWALIMACIMFSTMISTVFGVSRLPKYITYCHVMGLCAGLPATVLLVSLVGTEGAAYARLLSEILLVLGSVIFVWPLWIGSRTAGKQAPRVS